MDEEDRVLSTRSELGRRGRTDIRGAEDQAERRTRPRRQDQEDERKLPRRPLLQSMIHKIKILHCPQYIQLAVIPYFVIVALQRRLWRDLLWTTSVEKSE